MKTKITFLIVLLLGFICQAQTIEKFSIDSGGATATAGGIEVLYTIGEVNVQELSTSTISVSEGFINPQTKVLLELLAFLQGPLLNPATTGLMNDHLRAANYLPTTSPYADGATADPSVFSVTGSNAIVDWVWLELRAANDNTKIVNAKSALLQRNGLIVETDGVSNIQMNASPTNYYVVVKHRNHLGVMSASPIALSESEETVDFIDPSISTFGNNARVQLASGNMALWAGDVNGDKTVKFIGTGSDANHIKDIILNDPANTLNFITYSSLGYLNADVNLNGFGKFTGANNDSSYIKDNILAHPSNALGFATISIISTIPPTN